MQLADSSAIVVGGASGLGEASTRHLHSAGALVTIADVNAEKGQALASELGLDFVACDVREESQVQAAVEHAAQPDGGLRIAICCAGTGWAQKLAGSQGPHPLLPFETIISINLIGTFNVLRFAASAMIANEPLEDGERGVCVNTASIAAFDGQVGQIAYSASKGGVVGMTLPAARDLARYGVRVNTIAPGLFDTPLLAALPEEARQKLGEGVPYPQRLGAPSEYAQLACHIIENRMLNGETIRLDGALRMPPALTAQVWEASEAASRIYVMATPSRTPLLSPGHEAEWAVINREEAEHHRTSTRALTPAERLQAGQKLSQQAVSLLAASIRAGHVPRRALWS